MDIQNTNVVKEAIKQAIAEAKLGYIQGHGGPFGASLVKDNEIIAKAHNTVLKNNDCTCHAELSCIKEACKVLNTYKLDDCILVTTSQPCPMCIGAIQWSHIKTVIVCGGKKIADQFGFNDVVFEKNSGINLTFCDEEIEKKIIELFESWKLSNGVIY
jgi:guanine deaminase